MGGGEHIPMNHRKVSYDPGQNAYLHAVVDLGR
jgi:retrograde regulation protein 2